jgi:hypothetical protein
MLHEPRPNQQVEWQMWRAIMVWLLIMLVETVHGVARGLLLAPRVGEEIASRIGWPVGMILVLLVSAAAIRWMRIRGSKALLATGAMWAVLTIGFEFLIGYLRGMGWPEIVAELNPASGLMVYSAAVMFFAPLLAGRYRGMA